MLQSSQPARFVTAKMTIAIRLRPRARAPYGQRKGLVSRTEANFGDKVPFRTNLEGCKRAADAVSGSGASEMQDSDAFNSGTKPCVIRMVMAQCDSMESPRFRINKKTPQGPPSPPATVLHSPTLRSSHEAVVANKPNLTSRTIVKGRDNRMKKK